MVCIEIFRPSCTDRCWDDAAQRVTNETYRWVSDARFHPSGSKVVATKWYTSGRSLGAGEGWEYSLPDSGQRISSGSGKRLVGRTLPLGWSSEQYPDQQIGPEQFIWYGSDAVIYSKNVQDTNGQYTYSKGLYHYRVACSCLNDIVFRCTYWDLLDFHY